MRATWLTASSWKASKPLHESLEAAPPKARQTDKITAGTTWFRLTIQLDVMLNTSRMAFNPEEVIRIYSTQRFRPSMSVVLNNFLEEKKE
jgi:hypothetical protein